MRLFILTAVTMRIGILYVAETPKVQASGTVCDTPGRPICPSSYTHPATRQITEHVDSISASFQPGK